MLNLPLYPGTNALNYVHTLCARDLVAKLVAKSKQEFLIFKLVQVCFRDSAALRNLNTFLSSVRKRSKSRSLEFDLL